MRDETVLSTCYQRVIDVKEEISRGLAKPVGKGPTRGKVSNYSECFLPSYSLILSQLPAPEVLLSNCPIVHWQRNNLGK